MYSYSFLLFIKEICQMIEEHRRSRKSSSKTLYFKHLNNWVDLITILGTVVVSSILVVKEESTTYKMPWLGNLIAIFILITWFQFCKDLLECLPIAPLAHNLNMFYHVSRTYLGVTACFAPFLVAFAHTFKGEINSFYF